MAKSLTQPANLRDTAFLLRISLKMWHGKTKKRQLAERGADAIMRETGQSIDKKMLTSSEIWLVDQDAIAPLDTYATATRALWRFKTAPWRDDGMRIALTSGLVDLKKELNERRDTFLNNMVPNFVANYPALVRDAFYSLGPLYDPNDYPKDIRSCFDFKIVVEAIPNVADFRLQGVSQAELQDWLDDTEASIKDAFDNAQRDAWERLREPVANLAERLRTYDPAATSTNGRKLKGFEQGSIDNIAKIAEIMASINVYGDTDLTNLAATAKRVLTGIDAKTLKEDDAMREAVADQADILIEQMSQFI